MVANLASVSFLTLFSSILLEDDVLQLTLLAASS